MMQLQRSWKAMVLALGVALALIGATVPPVIPTVHAAAALQLSRSLAASGDTVAVRGVGFTPQGTAVVTVDFVNKQGAVQRIQTASSVDATGAFSTSFVVPGNLDNMTYSVSARDFHGHAAAANLTIRPVVVLHVGQAAPTITVVANRDFFVRGAGFQPGATVKIAAAFPLYNGNTVNVVRTVAADKTGSLGELLLRVPLDAKQGALSLTASGPKNAAQAHLAVTYRPTISLTASIVRPGSAVGVHGADFVPGSRIRVALTLALSGGATQTLTQDATADGNGNFSTSITLPSNAKVGTYGVKATGLVAGLSAASKLSVAVHPTISVQPATAMPGQLITVGGGGFSSGVAVSLTATIPLYGGGTKVISFGATTNASGDFAAHFALPSNAAAGNVSVTAKGPNGLAAAKFQIRHLGLVIVVSPSSAIPGGSIVIKGSGYPAGDKVSITIPVTLTNGAKQTLSATATAAQNGTFVATVRIPGYIASGSYVVEARSALSGRAPTARLTLVKLAPSVVAVPTTAVPGTQVTVNGFGFAAGQTIALALQGEKLGTTTTSASGQFSVKVTIPATLATGAYTLTATSSSGRQAGIKLAVNRVVSTHFYFASLYTGRGYQEYLAMLNPSAIQARVTITYEPTVGASHSKTITINPHSRYTENVNADVGFHVSTAAAVAADVPIAAERYVYHGSDGAVVPGVEAAATSWYFANGNTGKGYREYIAIQNPNTSPTRVAVHFLPTHHRAFTIFRNLAPTSRTTVKVNSYVRKDAVGVTVTSPQPIVANRTIYNKHGITSKIGAPMPQRTWYFAAGPHNQVAHNWIGAINPSGTSVHITLHAYGPLGVERGTVSAQLRPYARVGYLMNKIAHTADVAVVMQSSGPIVAEQTTYADRMHDVSTDTFGVAAPAKTWMFAAANTSTAGGATDILDLFNPNMTSIPIVVQFMSASGTVSERKFVVGPLYHQYVDVGSVLPNAQLGIVAASDYPFVALNRARFNFGRGGDTSTGIPA